MSKYLGEALQTQILGDVTVMSLPSVTEGDFNVNVKLIIVVDGSMLLHAQKSHQNCTTGQKPPLCCHLLFQVLRPPGQAPGESQS